MSPFSQSVAPVLTGRTVLQIIPELAAGGAERTTLDISAALNEDGARSLVASAGGRLVSELQARGGIWLPFPAKSKNPIAMALNVGKLTALLRSERVDLVHARSRAPAWVALAAARRAKVPFVTTFHGSYSGRSALKLQYNSIMARGDVVIANSQYTADLILRHYPFARERLRIIHRGTDLRAFAPSSVDPARVRRLRQDWGLLPDDRVVLLAARLTSWKGQKVLIEAARLLAERHLDDVRFILAGDPQGRTSYVGDLDRAIKTAGLGDIVRRVGHCTDMPAAFLAAAVAVMPSTEPEAFGRSAVEAQAMGTPVVVSALGAVPETVLAPPQTSTEARTGWHVAAGDAHALADAIAEALAMGASARDAMSFRARRHVDEWFSLDRMTRETLAVYTTLLDPAARARR